MNSYLFAPCVFIAGTDYRIIFITDKPGMAYVTVGDKKYCDAETGIMRWNTTRHAVTVPQDILDAAGSYTVHFLAMEDRAPYFAVHADDEAREYAFTPLDTTTGLRLYHIADTHGRLEEPVGCANAFPEHTLVFDGDIASHNSSPEDLYLLYKINERVTGGTKPIIFARGNHDTRGPMANLLPEMIPLENGNTYYTFTHGDVWGISLDCGEDKLDFHKEYGDSTAFEPYRARESEWLEAVLKKGEWKNFRYRIAICHIPFTMSFPAPFNIETDRYRRWTEILGEMGIQVLLSGHMHYYDVILPGGKDDVYGQRFPTVIGSSLKKEGGFTGCALEVADGYCTVRMTDMNGKISAEYKTKI